MLTGGVFMRGISQQGLVVQGSIFYKERYILPPSFGILFFTRINSFFKLIFHPKAKKLAVIK